MHVGGDRPPGLAWVDTVRRRLEIDGHVLSVVWLAGIAQAMAAERQVWRQTASRGNG
jgi:hypothetical protein